MKELPSTMSSPSPRRPGTLWVAVGATRLPILVLALVFSACSARVTGYQSPIAHDYAAVAWQPLRAAVAQPFVVGTGYSDAIANDPTTTPAQFQQRQAALPADARNGQLRELRFGVRLRDDDGARWQTGARAQLVYAPELDTRWPEPDFHAWPDSDRWLDELAGSLVVTETIMSPYPLLAGVTVRIATYGGDLTPGEATVGPLGAGVLDLPLDGAPLGTLAAGQHVNVLSAVEGWAQFQLSDGRTGFAPLAAFTQLPPPARTVGGALHAVLRDGESLRVLRETDVPAQQLRDNSHLAIRFDPISNSAGRVFMLELSMPDAQPGSGITLRATAPGTAAPSTTPQSIVDSAGFVAAKLVYRPIYEAAPPVLDLALDDLPPSGVWLRVTAPPAVMAGVVVALRIVPGTGPDADRLDYGVTTDRVPFGGWFAHDDSGVSLKGALLVSTRYQREIAVEEIARAGLRRLRVGARGDLAFSALFALTLIGLLIGAARLTKGGRRVAHDGR